MAEKEMHLLSDPAVKPDEKLISSFIGFKIEYWREILSFLKSEYREMSGDWRYYNDGKQWLFKLVQKKKTIFWAALIDDTFRITFYFTDKAGPLIDESDLPQKIKDDFRVAKKYGLIKPVSLKAGDKSDVDTVKKLVAIKVRLK